MLAELPRSWNTEISGESRNLPLSSKLNAMKLPTLPFPKPNVPSVSTEPHVPSLVRKLPKGFLPRPDRVIALMIRLVLSPYSASGARQETLRQFPHQVWHVGFCGYRGHIGFREWQGRQLHSVQ